MISQSCLHIRLAFPSRQLHIPVGFISDYQPMPHNVQSRRDVLYSCSPEYKSQMMIAIARQAKLDGVILHDNLGCEDLGLEIAQSRLALQKTAFPMLSFKGDMGDEREFDEARTLQRIDALMGTLGIKRVAD